MEGSSEEASFVELAVILDDGEAMTGAVALNRGYSVAIDDRKARRTLGEKAPEVRLVSTLDLMRQWSDTMAAQEVSQALQAMRHGAATFLGSEIPCTRGGET